MIRSAVLALAAALVVAGGASAETVARGVQDGMLALNARGSPSVAYVRGSTLFVATRRSKGRWARAKAASVAAGSSVMAFGVGAVGPVALVQDGAARRLTLVRRRSVGWQTIPLAGLKGSLRLGWPGLVLDRRGLPDVGYTRWNPATLASQLVLVRVDAKGRLRTTLITRDGFPQASFAPASAPVLVGGRVHVVESFGYKGVVGTYEWYPHARTWTGLGLDAGLGGFPIGPLFAGISPNGVLHAAWTESFGFDAPVSLATRGREERAEYLLDRALTTGLALPSTGPEIAANEWVGPEDVGLSAGANLWAGKVLRGKNAVELDGWLAGLALAPHGGRDLLLGGSGGLRWFHSKRMLSTRVTIDATETGGSVALTGRVGGVTKGRMTIYRERPGEQRRAIGRAAISGGAFSFTDHPASRPVVYRAVYVDPASGIPFAALSREPLG